MADERHPRPGHSASGGCRGPVVPAASVPAAAGCSASADGYLRAVPRQERRRRPGQMLRTDRCECHSRQTMRASRRRRQGRRARARAGRSCLQRAVARCEWSLQPAPLHGGEQWRGPVCPRQRAPPSRCRKSVPRGWTGGWPQGGAPALLLGALSACRGRRLACGEHLRPPLHVPHAVQRPWRRPTAAASAQQCGGAQRRQLRPWQIKCTRRRDARRPRAPVARPQ